MNFLFLRSVIGGTWHVNASTYFELMQLRGLILSGVQFDRGTPDASSLPYYIAAEDYSRFEIETAPKSGEYVAVTVLSGPMTKQDQYCGPNGTQRLMAFMLRADRDPDVIGHILYTDSGGGQSISLDPFKEEFANLKKPKVAFVENMAASAAMGAVSFCDEIYASKPKAVIGSIGTMIAFDGHAANSTGSDGTKHVRLYASKSVNKNGDFEKALNGNYTPLIENTLNPINEDFIAMVQANRPAITDALCDGSDHFAENVTGTLIDGVQSLEATVKRVIQLSQEKKSTEHNNSKNHHIMAKTNVFAALATVAGYPTLEVDKSGHISLQQAAAEKVSSYLGKFTAAVAAKDKAVTELNTANETIAARDKTIAGLQAKVTELEKEPGASSSTITTSSDDPTVDALLQFSVDSETSLEDMLEAFENYSE